MPVPAPKRSFVQPRESAGRTNQAPEIFEFVDHTASSSSAAWPNRPAGSAERAMCSKRMPAFRNARAPNGQRVDEQAGDVTLDWALLSVDVLDERVFILFEQKLPACETPTRLRSKSS